MSEYRNPKREKIIGYAQLSKDSYKHRIIRSPLIVGCCLRIWIGKDNLKMKDSSQDKSVNEQYLTSIRSTTEIDGH